MPYLKTIKETNKEQKKIFLKRNNITTIHKCYRDRLYASTAWRNKRFYKLQSNPLCELCQVHGTVTPANQIHHLIKFDKQPYTDLQYSLLTDDDNLICVCQLCHTKIHYKQDELTPEQTQEIKNRKDKVYNKYIDNGIHIVYTEDKNCVSN